MNVWVDECVGNGWIDKWMDRWMDDGLLNG